MKYVNGTDKKWHDTLWVYLNEFLAGFLFAFSCAVLFVVGLCIRALIFCKEGSSSTIMLLLGGLLILAISVQGAFTLVWYNSRFKISPNGISVVYPFFYPYSNIEVGWQNVKSILIRPVQIARSPVDYIIVQLAESTPECLYKYSLMLDLEICRKHEKDFLAFRSTDARLEEIRKYCSLPIENAD